MQTQLPPIIFRPELPRLPEPNVWLQPDAIVAYATLALALVTLYLAWQTRRMRLSSDTAMAELTKQAANAANASRDSAVAAQQSASHSEIMLQSRRAWVGVKDCDSTRASATAEPLNGHVWFVNSGDSPALDVQIGHNYAIWHQFEEDKVDYDDYFEPTNPVLGPNLPVVRFMEFKYRDVQSRQDVLEEVLTLFWYGIVKYRDIFDRERFTKFCFQYDVKNQKFELCLLHNSAT